MGAGFLATMLDQEMVEVKHKGIVSPHHTPDASLPSRTGHDVSTEMGHRYLLRYLTRKQLGSFIKGSTAPHYVTPTPFSKKELSRHLALPSPGTQRTFVLVLDPDGIDLVKGPRWVRGGHGIEYLLPQGFSADAIAFKGVGPQWEIEVW